MFPLEPRTRCRPPKGDTSTKPCFPEYDRLFAGGVQKGKLVIGMVNGLMADRAAGEKHVTIDDSGYRMWFEGLAAILRARPEMKLVSIEGVKDLTVTVAGKTFSPTFADVMNMEFRSTGFPAGLSYSDGRALRVALGDKSWVNGSDPVMGRFVGALVDGKQRSYSELLKASELTGCGHSWGQDALRVVDGKLDNLYTPAAKPIVLAAAK